MQIGELFDLAIFAGDSGEVRGPDVSAVPGAAKVRYHARKWAVQSVRVDSDDLHALFHQPQRAVASESGLREVFLRANPFIGARAQQNDIVGLQRVVDFLEAPLKNSHGDFGARLQVSDIQHDSRGETPFEWYLIDAARWFAFRYRAVMIRSIDMSPGMRDGLNLLHGPAQSTGSDKVGGGHTKHLPHLVEAVGSMIHVMDFGRHRLARRPVLKRDAKVNQ